ncbi:hypothetical protein CH63R_04993 [Colletotrichum higginsianum IMI 349063]|uniref:Uncharacterized protein n=3 Tax=Colletotrichum higginsianum TaxID=80884 RepID=A0A1B7YKX2_COLHI|nr:hypothetical protein CH63R_04993 [Colletotrichum higginsianum IMI 349063]OBR12697.1 hypothetical protein CH63R_04993 [Colletotrichum higginsianum IMI 349063]TIC99647.1 hypothetical protein CH35J_005218 [Colletotrichum higginsianum]
MCEDRHSESSAGDGVASTRAYPPSASGRSSRPPSPGAVASEAAGRRIPRSPLAPHAESLIDMEIPQAAPSPRPGRKRGLDELFGDSTPPSPDKLQRELDRQHQEALEARRSSSSSSSTSLLIPTGAHPGVRVQDSKRQKKLVYRCKPAEHDATPRSTVGRGNDDGDGYSYAAERLSGSPADSSRHHDAKVSHRPPPTHPVIPPMQEQED